jgi:hypothetical protein
MYPYIREHTKWALACLPIHERFPDGRPKVVIELGNEIVGNGAADLVEAAIAPELVAAGIEPDQISIGAYTWPRKWDPKSQTYAPANEFAQIDLCQKALAKVYEAAKGEACATAIRRMAWRETHSWLESPQFDDRPFGEQHELHAYEYSAGGRQCQSIASMDGECMLATDPHANLADSCDGDNIRALPDWIYAGAMDLLRRFAKTALYMQAFGEWIEAGTICRIGFEYFPGGWSLPVHVAGVTALARAHKDFFGVWPANYGNVPPIAEPDPEPEPEPPPVVPPVTPPTPTKERIVEWHGWRRSPPFDIDFRLLFRKIRFWLTGRA